MKKSSGKAAPKVVKPAKASNSPKAAKSVPSDGGLTHLIERNYASLRTIARREIVQRKLQRTTTPTSLVAETVMRLMRQRQAPQSNSQLCGLATILMTRALADRSRRSRARKRGSARKAMELDESIERDLRTDAAAPKARAPQALQSRVLNCLQSLSREHPREMETITLHLVLGFSVEKVAKLMGVSRRTAYRSLAVGLETLREEVGVERLGEPE